MVEAIDPLQIRLARLLGDDELVAQASTPVVPQTVPGMSTSSNPFEDILSKAVDALEGVSKSEATANQLINQYVHGEADLQDVMIATSKMSITVQLAVTTINSAVSTFKEITQMQV